MSEVCSFRQIQLYSFYNNCLVFRTENIPGAFSSPHLVPSLPRVPEGTNKHGWLRLGKSLSTQLNSWVNVNIQVTVTPPKWARLLRTNPSTGPEHVKLKLKASKRINLEAPPKDSVQNGSDHDKGKNLCSDWKNKGCRMKRKSFLRGVLECFFFNW